MALFGIYLFHNANLYVCCAGCWYLLIELLLHLVTWRQTYDNPLRSNPAYSVVKWVNHQKFFCYASSCCSSYFTVNYLCTSSITSYDLSLWFQAVLCWHGWYCPTKGESSFLTCFMGLKVSAKKKVLYLSAFQCLMNYYDKLHLII